MSDILIRGMEMPKEFDPDVYIELACGIDDKRYARLYNFHQGGLTEWCEVVSVPKHGRLIDANALTRFLLNKYWDSSWISSSVLDRFVSEIANAPTIIPARRASDEAN